MIALLSLGWLLLGSSGRDVVIGGATICPTASAVTKHLLPLLGEDSSTRARVFIELSEPAAKGSAPPRQILVRITRDGTAPVTVVRDIAASASCEDAASDLAVFVAAGWGARYPTQALEELDLPRTAPPPSERAGSASTAALPAGAANASGLDANTATVAAHGRTDGNEGTSAGGGGGPRRAGAVGAAAGVLSGGTSGGATAQIVVDATLELSPRWLGRAAAWASGERALPVLSGQAVWRRIGLSVGGGRRWRAAGRSHGAHLDLTMAITAAYSPVRGVGFLDNRATSGMDVGLVPAVRLGWETNRLPLDLWIELDANLWIASHELVLGGTAESRFLPRAEGVALGGVSYRFAP